MPPSDLSRRAALGLSAAVVLAWAVAPSGGMYTHVGAVGVLVALGLAVAACSVEGVWRVGADLGGRVLGYALVLLAARAGFTAVGNRDALAGAVALIAVALLLQQRRGRLPTPADPFSSLLTAALVLFAGLGALQAEVLCGAHWQERTPLLALAGAGGFVAACAWVLAEEKAARVSKGIALGAFVAGALLRVGGVLGSPEPIVDVAVALRDAPTHLLAGRNPYASDYPDPYDTDRARAFGLGHPPHSATYPFYPPHPFLAALPFRAAGLDARWANVVADLAAAAVLYLAAQRRPRVAGLLASLYLLTPRVPFLIEHGWYEPMLAAALGGGLLLVERGWRIGYLALGCGLTAKQFGPVMLGPLLRAHGRSWKVFAGSVVVTAALAAPFVLWNPSAFLEATVFSILRRPPMSDSLALPSATLNLFGVAPPRWLMLAAVAVVVGWLTFRCRAAGTASGLAAGTALLTFCVLNTQGYFNYFYLVNYLLLLGLARHWPRDVVPCRDDAIGAPSGSGRPATTTSFS